MENPNPSDPLEYIPAWLCGAAGGATASLGQFVGTTLNQTLDHFFAGDIRAAMIKIAYFLIAALLMALGGAIVAFFLQSRTKNRWTLFWAGAAALSIGSAALPGFARLLQLVEISPVSIAYAQTQAQPLCDDASFSVVNGLKQFFRIETGYRVVVGSFKNSEDAQALAKKVNVADPSLHAVVGEKARCNDFYPVIVGRTAASLEDAKEIQAKALALDFIPGAYISKRPN